MKKRGSGELGQRCKTLVHSCLYVIPVPGNLTPSSGFCDMHRVPHTTMIWRKYCFETLSINGRWELHLGLSQPRMLSSDLVAIDSGLVLNLYNPVSSSIK